MALMTMTARYGELDDWPGRLFEVNDGATFLARTATQFTFRHLGGDFAGFTVSFRGTGFAYQQGTVVDGTIGSVEVRNAQGQVLFTLSGLGSATFANDLAQVVSDIFGSPFGDAGPGPDGKMAWNRLFSGNDTINGTSGNDWREIVGLNAGNDVFNMGAGDDFVGGGMGNDTMRGGDGYDFLSYRETTYNEGGPAVRGLVLNVATGVARDPWGFTDRFSGFEEFQGSRFDDRMVQGNDDRARFSGLRGNDTLIGGTNGNDEVSYRDDYWQGGRFGIVADLQVAISGSTIVGRIRDGFGNVDRTENIERVSGTRFNDSFTGSNQDNVFWGGEGRDVYRGEGGFDVVRIGRWFGDNDPGGVVVDLARTSGQVQNDGFGNVETLVSIEGIHGGDMNDRISGNAQGNDLQGGRGSDTLTGRGGEDYFGFFSQEDAQGGVDTITDFQTSGGAADKLYFGFNEWDGMTSTVRLVNGPAATFNGGQFVFRASDDTLYWDPDGTGSDAPIAVVRLIGVNALTTANFDLFD